MDEPCLWFSVIEILKQGWVECLYGACGGGVLQAVQTNLAKFRNFGKI